MVSHKKGVRKYYAVRAGNKPGVYHTYDDCLAQVKGFKGAIFKSFGTLTEAESFVEGQGDFATTAGTPSSSSKPKFYAVHRGIRPGVYRTWDEAKTQIYGAKMPLQRAFLNLEDAEFFVKHGVMPSASNRARKSPTSASSKKSRSGVVDEQEEEVEDDEDQEVEDSIAPTTTKRNREEVEDEDVPQEAITEAKTPAAKRQKKTPAPAADEVEEAKEEEQNFLSKPQTKTPAAKKQKKASAPAAAEEEEGIDEAAHAPGTGPLPKGATDGFDPRVILTPNDGKDGTPARIEYKFANQREAMKMQPQGRRKRICIDIYTDGSCRANGQGKRAIAGWGVYFGPYHKMNASGPLPGPRQTNQRAELLAILKAFALCPGDAHVRIVTDSQYAINCVTSWSKKWKENDWRTATGKPVENKDLIEPIIAKLDERTGLGVETRFVWVKGHAGDEGNEGADRLAVEGAGRKTDSASYLEHVRQVAEAEKGIGEGVHQKDLEKKEPPSVADEAAEEEQEDGKQEDGAQAQPEQEEKMQADMEVEVEPEVEPEVEANVAVAESVFADDARAAAHDGAESVVAAWSVHSRESRVATPEL